MLVKKKESPVKTVALLFLTFGVMGVTGFVLYQNFFPSTSTTTTNVNLVNQGTKNISAQKVQTNFENTLLEDEVFEEMNVHGNVPVKVRSVGKKDLFGIE